MSGVLRDKPYFWVTWLAPLLTGKDSCEYKVWLKAHYKDLDKLPSDFDSETWNSNHTALLNKVRDEYRQRAKTVLVERPWRIDGRTATVAGKIDLVTLEPNMVIDAKTGSRKDSHSAQVKIYLLAVAMGAVKGASGNFIGLLRYGNLDLLVDAVTDQFKQRFFDLVKRLASTKPEPVPSYRECRFCDLVDCKARVTEETVLQTAEF